MVFDLGETGMAVVEVKDGRHDGDLVKGIYQAVKYRAPMKAEMGQGEEYPVSALLVAFKMPDHMRQLGDLLGVECRRVSTP